MLPRDKYDSLFIYYAQGHGLDWRLLKAQMLAESSGNPDAESPVGARGLAQFMRRTWEEWRDGTPGIQEPPPGDLVLLDPRDPEDAIRAQAAYMGWLLKQVGGSVALALAAYNWGIGRVRQVFRRGKDFGGYVEDLVPFETREYVARVYETWNDLREGGGR